MTKTLFARPLIVATLLAASLLGAHAAHADTVSGYVCGVQMYPDLGGGYGEAGNLIVYTSPNEDCTGTQKFTYFCSEGATNSSCTSNSRFHVSERMMLALFDGIQRAMAWGARVHVHTDTGATYRGQSIKFLR